MSINFNCTKRIKPKLLREQKTEALLVFIRTTLEQYFKDLENGKTYISIGTEENLKYVNRVLKKLLTNLQVYIVNSTYLRSLIIKNQADGSLKLLLKKEEPLMIYYDSLVKGIERNLFQGENWIPELIVIALLSEWILEEERSTYLYPFLDEIDYLELLEIYDKERLNCDSDKKEIIINMYKISTILIKSLKKSTYKTSKKNKKIRNKKRKK